MDTTFLLPLAVLFPLSLTLYFFLTRKRSSGHSRTPPGSSGWPMVGENMDFAFSGPEKFIAKRMEKFSPYVFKTTLMGEKMAIFCGAQGNKFLFTNESKLLSSWWPKSMKKSLLFPVYVDDPSKNVAALTHKFLEEALRPEALKQYVPIMDSMARKHIERDWAPHGEVKVFPLSQIYTFALACKIFMDIDDADLVMRLMRNFNGVTTGMLSVPINFPGTAYSAAIKRGKLVREELMKIIGARKKELAENKERVRRDLMSQMLLIPDENRRFLSEMEISNSVVGLLIASYETTSIAVSFVLKHLAELPHIYKEVLREHVEIIESKAPGELLKWEDIQKMAYSWNVARESFRMTPPAQGSFRKVIADFEFAGFTIPKGWKTSWNVHTTHNNPQYFPNPEKFDPSRFEGRGPQPYTFVPFGGGPRMCPGKEYARLEILVYMHNIVKNFKLEKSICDEKNHSPVPSIVRVHHHKKK